MSDSRVTERPDTPGYDFGHVAASPVTEEDLRRLEQTVGWTERDAEAMRKHRDKFHQRAEHMVDSWRSVIGAQPHLAKWFVGPDGKPEDEYKARVKRRFVQWVIDVATRNHDRDWLNYQEEIGLRHTPAKKNVTDRKETPSLVPLRYLLGFVPVVLPIRRFLSDLIEDEAEIASVEAAWTKAVLLHIALWSRAYVTPGLW